MVFFSALLVPRPAAGDVTFPLEQKWQVALPAPPAFAPAFDRDYLYIALRTDELVALLIDTGGEVWWVDCPMTAPPAAGDALVFVGRDGLVEARAQADGSVRWQRAVPGRIARLHWDTGWLIASNDAGLLVAMRAVDGAILWQRDLGSPLSASPAPTGDRLYAALGDGRILALALQTGDPVWVHTLAEPAVGILPVGNRLFVGARDNQFHSLDVRDGDADWRWKTGADLLGEPVLDDRRVFFVALDNILRGHDRNGGSMLWKRVLPMRPFTGALKSGPLLIVSGVAAELHAYTTHDGQPAGTFAVKGDENEEMLLAAPPHLTAHDLIILITKGGQVRAVGSPPPAPEPPAAAPDAGSPPGEPAPGASPAPADGAGGTPTPGP